MRRVGDHEWDVAPRLATEFDGEARFAYLRQLFAETMTEVCRAHGKNRTYTHLSNAARGLRAAPLIPLGPALTKAVRDGQVVGANERNRLQIARNETMMREDLARRRDERKAACEVLDQRLRDMTVPSRAPLPALAVSEVTMARPLTLPAAVSLDVAAVSMPPAPPYIGLVQRPVCTRKTLPTLSRLSPTIDARTPIPLPDLHDTVRVPYVPTLPVWARIDPDKAVIAPARLPKAITKTDDRGVADTFAILERLRLLDEATDRAGRARQRRAEVAAKHRETGCLGE